MYTVGGHTCKAMMCGSVDLLELRKLPKHITTFEASELWVNRCVYPSHATWG